MFCFLDGKVYHYTMTPNTVMVHAYGKINLTLDIVGKRHDGYHDIISIMQSISLFDRLRLTETAGEIVLECNCSGVPLGEDNLCCRAAQELRRAAGVRKGVYIKLSKGIPVAAGLGGGSADAAGVLWGLNRLWQTGFTLDRLREIGSGIGADVPFCLTGGTSLAEGIGEKLTPLPRFPKQWLFLVKPPFDVSTGEIYKAYDSAKIVYRPDTVSVLDSIRTGNIDRAIQGMGNTLEQVTGAIFPEVKYLTDELRSGGAEKVIMCGSGPMVCAFVNSRAAGEKLKARFSGYPGETYLAHSVTRGIVLLARLKRGERFGRKKTFTDTARKL